MIDVVVSVLSGLSDVGRRVGLFGLFVAVVVIGVAWLGFRCADQALSTASRAAGVWQRLPVSVRQIVVVVVAWFVGWRYLVAHWRPALAVAAVGWYAAYWVGAQHLRRGDTESSNWEVWRRWGRATARTRAHDAGARSALGKDDAPKVVAVPVVVGDVERVIYRPPDGMNARTLAEKLRDGDVDSAVTRRLGTPLRAISAVPQPDGTVLALYDTRPAVPAADLTEVEWWTP